MMTKPRLDGIYLLLIGTLLFLILGIALEQNSPHAMQDFRVLYNPARCLLQHCDPYNEREVLRLYREEGGDQQSETPVVRVIVTRYIYPPTAFLCTVPFCVASLENCAHTLDDVHTGRYHRCFIFCMGLRRHVCTDPLIGDGRLSAHQQCVNRNFR